MLPNQSANVAYYLFAQGVESFRQDVPVVKEFLREHLLQVRQYVRSLQRCVRWRMNTLVQIQLSEFAHFPYLGLCVSGNSTIRANDMLWM